MGETKWKILKEERQKSRGINKVSLTMTFSVQPNREVMRKEEKFKSCPEIEGIAAVLKGRTNLSRILFMR